MKKNLFVILIFAAILLASCDSGLKEAPTASKRGGLVDYDTPVVLSTSVKNAQIYYTVDGTDPAFNSMLYTSPIQIVKNTVVKAIAVKSGKIVSEQMTVEYLVKAGTPSPDNPESTYVSSKTIALSCSTSGAIIYYTIDGETPTTSSRQYVEPITLSQSTTIKAIAVCDEFEPSEVTTLDYKIKVANPSSSLATGAYDTAKSVTLSCDTEDASIYFTFDGTTPTKSGNLYSSELTLSSSLIADKRTMKIIAMAEGCEPSDVVTYTYTMYTKGPAGGYIFYDCDADNNETNNGAGPDKLKSEDCGWRYLEAAPEDISVDYISTFVFGFYRTEVNGTHLFVNGSSYVTGTSSPTDGKSTGTALGTGMANTIKLVSKMGTAAYSYETTSQTTANYAAKLCYDYTYGDCDDWFLPSNSEISRMYYNLAQKGVGGFASANYWSSSENYYVAYRACCMNFGYGASSDSFSRNELFRVRAIRSFLTFED